MRQPFGGVAQRKHLVTSSRANATGVATCAPEQQNKRTGRDHNERGRSQTESDSSKAQGHPAVLAESNSSTVQLGRCTETMETLFPRMTREKALLQPPLRQSAMKTGLLFFLLTYGFRDHSVAHYAPVQETAGAEYYHQQWRYYPSYTVGGFQYPYPHSGTCGYTCHSHHYVPPYPGGRYHAAYPHPPPPPPPPPASSVPQFGHPGFTGPWVPGPVLPPPPTPRNLDPF